MDEGVDNGSQPYTAAERKGKRLFNRRALGANRGTANVLRVGTVVATFDGYASSRTQSVVVGSYALSDTGQHTITLQVSRNSIVRLFVFGRYYVRMGVDALSVGRLLCTAL